MLRRARNLPFFLFERKRFDFSGKIKKNIDFVLFGLCSGPLGGACTAKKWSESPKSGKGWKKAGKKLAVWGWALGGQKWPEIIKKNIFGKSKVGAFI